jgi:hypothetical protein
MAATIKTLWRTGGNHQGALRQGHRSAAERTFPSMCSSRLCKTSRSVCKPRQAAGASWSRTATGHIAQPSQRTRDESLLSSVVICNQELSRDNELVSGLAHRTILCFLGVKCPKNSKAFRVVCNLSATDQSVKSKAQMLAAGHPLVLSLENACC